MVPYLKTFLTVLDFVGVFVFVGVCVFGEPGGTVFVRVGVCVGIEVVSGVGVTPVYMPASMSTPPLSVRKCENPKS